MIYVLDRPRDRAGLAIPDRAEVDFTQPNALCRRAADKDFVRDIELVTRDGLLEHIMAQILRNRMNSMTCDPLQDGRRGRSHQFTAPHHKEVFASTFGHVSLRVEHD